MMITKSFFLSIILLISLSSQAQDSLRFLALGDSYTIGESVNTKARWPIQLADSLNKRGYAVSEPSITAKTGWRTDQLKEAIRVQNPSKDFDLVGLLIGVNNQYQGKSSESYKPEFKQLLEMAISHAGGDKSRVFVVSIPDYGYTPFGSKNQERISRELDVYNKINRTLSEEAGVRYFYITDISRQDDDALVASDGLHPSGKQYSLWVEKILEDKSFVKMLE